MLKFVVSRNLFVFKKIEDIYLIELLLLKGATHNVRCCFRIRCLFKIYAYSYVSVNHVESFLGSKTFAFELEVVQNSTKL